MRAWWYLHRQSSATIIILVAGVALILLSLFLEAIHSYAGIRGVICVVLALLVMGGIVVMDTIARFNIKF